MATKQKPTEPPIEPDPDVTAAVETAAENFSGEFDDDFETPAEEQEPPAGQAAAPDPLDTEVPAESLSGYWKNQALQQNRKITMRDLVRGADTAEDRIRQQGEQANAARDELRATRAMMQAMQEQLAALTRGITPAPRGPSFEDVGITDPDNAIINEPGRSLRGTAELGARLARTELDPRIQGVEQSIQRLEQTFGVLNTRLAKDQARAELGIPLQEWQAIEPFLWAYAGYHQATPAHPQAWKDAYGELDKARPRAAVEPRVTRQAEGIVRGNPSGSSRQSPVRVPTAPGKRIRGMVAEGADILEKTFGVPKEMARQTAERAEEILQSREAKE